LSLVSTSEVLAAGVNKQSIGGYWCERAKYWPLVLTSEVLAAGVNERSICRWCKQAKYWPLV
jgi:hypothetical protein